MARTEQQVESLGALLKAARTLAGLTQAELAKQVGLTSAELSKAERDLQALPTDTLRKIGRATGASQKALLEAAKTPGKGAAKDAGEDVLTGAEKTLLKYYRKAEPEQRQDALKILKGEKTDVELLVSSLLGEARYQKLLKKTKK